MNTIWTYTLELAGVIADLYSKNSKYANVRVFLPNYGKSYSENFQDRLLTDLQNVQPKKLTPIFLDASHKELNESAMQPRIVLHFAPQLNTTEVHLVAIDEANFKIEASNMQTMSAEDAGQYYYSLSNDTQEYYEQIING